VIKPSAGAVLGARQRAEAAWHAWHALPDRDKAERRISAAAKRRAIYLTGKADMLAELADEPNIVSVGGWLSDESWRDA
jgi:hypothetical protein